MKAKLKKTMWIALVLAMLIMALPFNVAKVYAAGDVAINESNFPDANFREYVEDNLQRTVDGTLSQEELNAIVKINVSGKGITSLKGIEYFTNLRVLDCSRNQVTTLDVSHNPALERLICYNTQLTSLDVSQNPSLKDLDCSSNPLTSLDVSHNPLLTNLYCDNSQVTTLDVSQNPALEGLTCYNNQLTSLDVSHNPSLKYLDCDNNQVTTLDVSQNPALERLTCYNNQVTSLDVSQNPLLTNLYCDNNQVTSLDVSYNPLLRALVCSSNQLTSLDVSHNPSLEILFCNGNQLTSLDVSHNPALERLDCRANQLTSLDVSHNPDLERLDCRANQVTSLDVSHNPSLKDLDCRVNQLTSLDVSHNPLLTHLACSFNPLTTLDVSQNPALTYLDCSSNQLTSLKLPSRSIEDDKKNIRQKYTINVPKESSIIEFPPGFDASKIQGTVAGLTPTTSGMEWDGQTKSFTFQYILCDNPKEIASIDVELIDLAKAKEKAKTEIDQLPNLSESEKKEAKGKVDNAGTKGDVAKAVEDAKAKDAANKNAAGQVVPKPAPAPTPQAPGIRFFVLAPERQGQKPVEVKKTNQMTLETIIKIGSKKLTRIINGQSKEVEMDVAAYADNNRSYIPLRFVGEAMGFDVRWDNEARMAILKNKDKEVKVSVDSNIFYINGEKFESDVKPQIKNNRTMIPVGNFARCLGLKDGKDIFWDQGSQQVTIKQVVNY